MIILFLFIFTVFALYYIVYDSSSDNNKKIPTVEKPEDLNKSDYQPKSLLTKYEQINYQRMKGYAAAHNLIICPKVRLADLIEPKPESNRSIWQKRFNMICSKHVDFVLCNEDMSVIAIIELDDSSHNRPDRQARDRFVDAVLTNSGYHIMHTPTFDDVAIGDLDNILEKVAPELLPPKEPDAQIKIARTVPSYEEWKEQQLAQKHPG